MFQRIPISVSFSLSLRKVYILRYFSYKPYSYDRHIDYVFNSGITATALDIGVVLLQFCTALYSYCQYKKIGSSDMKPYQSPWSQITQKLRTFFNRSKPMTQLLALNLQYIVEQDSQQSIHQMISQLNI